MEYKLQQFNYPRNEDITSRNSTNSCVPHGQQ